MERGEILKSIDTLIEQAGGKISDEGVLRVELESLNKEIQSFQTEIVEIKATPQELYNDTNKRILDEQAVVQNKNKIRLLNKDLKAKQKELNKIKESEKKLNDMIADKKENLNVTQSSIDAIKTRINDSTSLGEIKLQYNDLLEKKNKVLEEQNQSLNTSQEEYALIQDKLLFISEEVKDIEREIKEKEDIVKSLEESLSNKDNYINIYSKAHDERKLADLEGQLKVKEARRNEIVSNPVIIGSEAKKAVIDSDVTLVINKANELVKIAINNNEYMSVSSKEELQKEYDVKSAERDKYHSEIDQRDFSVSKNGIEDTLIEYLNNRKNTLLSERELLTKKMLDLDKDEVYDNQGTINKIHNEIGVLRNEIKRYKSVVEKTENLGEKAEIQAAYENKKHQRNISDYVLNTLVKYQSKDILKANEYNDKISEIDNQIDIIDSQIEEINKLKLQYQSEGKDLLAQKAAMAELKEKAKVVQNIKFAMKFDKTPQQIVDEISQSLGTNLTPIKEEKEVTKVVEEEPVVEEVKEKVLTPLDITELITDNKINEESKVVYKQAFLEESKEEELNVQATEEVEEIKNPIFEKSATASKVVATEEVKINQNNDTITIEQPQDDINEQINNINEFFNRIQNEQQEEEQGIRLGA